MKLILPFLIGLVALGTGTLQAQSYEPRTGDLLFQDMDCGPMCDAIEKVTDGTNGIDFSHMGLVYVTENGVPMVIEAVTAGVVATPLDAFTARSKDEEGKPKVVVARMPDSLVTVSHQAVSIARTQLGMPYDNAFLPNNNKWYCSELIAFAFNKAADKTLFANAPMTFKDPTSNLFFPTWVEHYQNMEMRIPEGQPGCNPGGMSKAPFLVFETPYADFNGALQQQR